jgi:hypothetical protein
VASRRVLEKAGLNFDRIFHQPWPNRVDGGEFGDVEYAVTKDGMAAAKRPHRQIGQAARPTRTVSRYAPSGKVQFFAIQPHGSVVI